jgi:threonine dehydratase
VLTRDDVRAAAVRIAPFVQRTRLVPTPDPTLWLKLENEQRSGAFKARGAFSALTSLAAEQRAHGVVTHSSGNHGRALAEAAAALGCPVTIVVPDNALPHKVAAIRAAGATVVVVAVAERAERAAALVEQGLTLVPPFDHLDVMAGQGTVALELLEQTRALGLPLRRVWAPIGGGGLLSGIAVALDDTGVTPVGVEPDLAADYVDSVHQKRLVAWSVRDTSRTVADGLRLPSVGRLPWAHLDARHVRAVTVGEGEILAAQQWLDDLGISAEPSGAVSVAAARRGRRDPGDGVEVAVVSGGNRAPRDRG